VTLTGPRVSPSAADPLRAMTTVPHTSTPHERSQKRDDRNWSNDRDRERDRDRSRQTGYSRGAGNRSQGQLHYPRPTAVGAPSPSSSSAEKKGSDVVRVAGETATPGPLKPVTLQDYNHSLKQAVTFFSSREKPMGMRRKMKSNWFLVSRLLTLSLLFSFFLPSSGECHGHL